MKTFIQGDWYYHFLHSVVSSVAGTLYHYDDGGQLSSPGAIPWVRVFNNVNQRGRVQAAPRPYKPAPLFTLFKIPTPRTPERAIQLLYAGLFIPTKVFKLTTVVHFKKVITTENTQYAIHSAHMTSTTETKKTKDCNCIWNSLSPREQDENCNEY